MTALTELQNQNFEHIQSVREALNILECEIENAEPLGFSLSDLEAKVQILGLTARNFHRTLLHEQRSKRGERL